MKKCLFFLFFLSYCLPSQAQWTYNTLANNLYTSNVASIGNKIIFYTGGRLVGTSSVLSEQIEIFDVSSNTKQVFTAPVGVARVYASAAVLGSKVLFAGGYGNLGETTRVDLYDTLTGAWTTAALSAKRRDMGAAATSDKAFFGGGYGNGTPSKVVDIYNLATDTWTATQFPNATLPSQRSYLSAAVVGNKVLFGGGLTNSYRNLVSIYDAQNNTWLPNTILSQYKASLEGISYHNKAFFIGGTASLNGSPSSLYPSDTIDIYDGSTDTWSILKIPRIMYTGNGQKRGYADAKLAGCKIFIVPSDNSYTGGPTPGSPDTIAVYDLARDVWSYLTLPHPRSGIIIAAAQNKVYFAGGANATAPFSGLNHIDIYTVTPKLQLAIETTPVTEYAYDFGEQLLGEQAEKQLDISNEGDYELVFKELPTKIMLSGDVTEFSIDATSLDETDTLDPAEIISLPIAFQPSTEGDKTLTIEVYSNDPDAPTYTFTIKGKGVIANSTLENETTENVLSVFPVPCNEQVQVQIKKNYQDASLILRDVLGNKLIKTAHIKTLSSINTASLSAGIYVLEIRIDEQVYTKRIVVSR